MQHYGYLRATLANTHRSATPRCEDTSLAARLCRVAKTHPRSAATRAAIHTTRPRSANGTCSLNHVRGRGLLQAGHQAPRRFPEPQSMSQPQPRCRHLLFPAERGQCVRRTKGDVGSRQPPRVRRAERSPADVIIVTVRGLSAPSAQLRATPPG